MNNVTRAFLTAGIVFFLLAGLSFIYARFGLQKLPGDIVVEKKSFTFIFPLISSIVLSIIVTLLMRLWSKN